MATRTSARGQRVGERQALRLGGVCAILGGLGYVGVGAAHRDLPSDTIEAALGHVASRPAWTLIHLAGIGCVLLWVAAVAGLGHSLRTEFARMLGTLAVAFMALGAAVFVIDYSIDGYALKTAADAWAAADSADAEAWQHIGTAIFTINEATVRAATTWTFGLPFVLTGLAVAAERQYPSWLGWIATATGGATVLSGLIAYLDSQMIDGFLLALAFSAASALWLAALGVLMCRRAAS